MPNEAVDAKAVAQSVLHQNLVGARLVDDAFQLVVAAGDEYVESAVALETMVFGTGLAAGLAASAQAPVGGATRASSTMTLPLTDSSGGAEAVTVDVTLYGPGDVRALDPTEIVRRYPAPDSLDAEETVFAHVELDRPELPWAFSAAAPGAGLRPWLALVVLEAATVRWEPAGSALLPILQTPLDQLPVLADRTHLFAHAQTSSLGGAADTDEAPLSVRFSPAHRAVNLSRLVSTRVLADSTDYVAAIVPITAVGVQAGLGLTGGDLGPAWAPGGPDPVRLPVFDHWSFRTAPDGTFTSLASRLQGVAAPYEVGRRFFDVSSPGAPLTELAPGAAGRKQVLHGALVSPTPPSTPEQQALEAARWDEPQTAALRAALERPAELGGSTEPGEPVPALPIVGPRLYGAHQRGSATVEGGDWFAELNLAPTLRVAAGLGTRVVQRDQEQLMAAAWAQLGEVLAANRAIAMAQLAELVNQRVHGRLGGLEVGRLVQLTAPLATRLATADRTTLAGQVAGSATPVSATRGAFRRLTRPGGPALRRASTATRTRLSAFVGDAVGLRDFTRTYVDPDGIRGLSAASVAAFDRTAVAEVIGGDATAVTDTLSDASATLREAGGLTTWLLSPQQWPPVDAQFDAAGELATEWGTRLVAEVSEPAVQRIRAQRVGPLAAELTVAGPKIASAELRAQLTTTAVTLNDRAIDGVTRVRRRPPGGGVVGGGPVRRGRAAALRRIPVGDGPRRGGIGLNRIDTSTLVRLDGADAATRKAGLETFAELAVTSLAPDLARARTVTADLVRARAAGLVDRGGLLEIAAVPRRDRLDVSPAALRDQLAPARTVRAALAGRLQLAPGFRERWLGAPRIAPIMAAPHFDRAMHAALSAGFGDGPGAGDWLVPGIGLLPADDFVTVLSTNATFTASFLVGLSDEMGRELFWRGYPTDRRGTYFRHFWTRSASELKQPIHRFSVGGLADQVSLGSGDGRAAIIVKSELVRRFPDLIIAAVRNQGADDDHPEFEGGGGGGQITAPVLFADLLAPDTAVVGLDLSVPELEQPGWWILVSEHPSATRFVRRDNEGQGRRYLTDGPPGQQDAARWAASHLHDPMRVAFPAADLISTGA